MAQPARSLTSRRGALLRYRVMAYIVGVMLIVVFVSIPFDSVEAVVGPIHGVLYILYLMAVAACGVRVRLKLWTFVAMVASGWLPFLAFVMECWVTPPHAPGGRRDGGGGAPRGDGVTGRR